MPNVYRPWKFVPDKEVRKIPCPDCGAKAKSGCRANESKSEKYPTRKEGMHFARWEARYVELHGSSPNVPAYDRSSVPTISDAFNGRL